MLERSSYRVISDLKSIINNEAICVDLSLVHGEAGLSLELKSGCNVWTPVCVMKPDGEKKCLTAVELSNMDDIEFLSHTVDDVPGVVLTKGSSRVRTPVASRTRSRLKNSDAIAK